MCGAELDTIAAIATPPGKGGVGIVRVSGPLVTKIIPKVLKKTALRPWRATYTTFIDSLGKDLDQGLALYFQAPHSFTGEDVIELQGHGGPVVQDLVLQAVIDAGARLAQPGEFSQRAFINQKLDLVQAEAIADLIHAQSRESARGALRSLSGAFSKAIDQLVEAVIHLRALIEADIDFSDQDLELITQKEIEQQLDALNAKLEEITAKVHQGVLLKEGVHIVLAGAPNAGKSTLFNLFAGRDRAIVSEIPGTTRDLLSETILMDNLIVHLTDTAGIRFSEDSIEQEGIRRAKNACDTADIILAVVEATEEDFSLESKVRDILPMEQYQERIVVIVNKMDNIRSDMADLIKYKKDCKQKEIPVLLVSAKTEEGIPELKTFLKRKIGFSEERETEFTARRRHLESLEKAKKHLCHAKICFQEGRLIELLAEELRLMQLALDEITGKFSADDLLGRIFSEFCIGK